MIHKTRALFRQLTNDEDYLFKQKLVDLFLHDETTQKSLQHISGFLFHALNTAGTFETSLHRYKTKVSGKLNMDEFMAFLNTAAINMAKGQTPNSADLMSRHPEPQQGEQEQGQSLSAMNTTAGDADDPTPTRTKMMSSLELRTLLRPQSSNSASMQRIPPHLTQPSPFSTTGSVVVNKRKKRPNTAHHIRPLSKTAFGTHSIESNSSLISSSSIVQQQQQQQQQQQRHRRWRKRRPHSSGVVRTNGRRPQTVTGISFLEDSFTGSFEGSTRSRELGVATGTNGTGSTGSTGGTAADLINLGGRESVLGGSGVNAGGSAVSIAETNREQEQNHVNELNPPPSQQHPHPHPHHGSHGSSIVEEFEWNRSQQYLNESASHATPTGGIPGIGGHRGHSQPSTTLMSRNIDMERKIRELSLVVLRSEAKRRKDSEELASTHNQLAKLQGKRATLYDLVLLTLE